MKRNTLLAISLLCILSCTPEAMKAYFSIEEFSEKIILGNAANAHEYTIRSNTEWKISQVENQSWCTVTPSQGNGDAVITINTEANPGKGRRTMFQITAKGVQSKPLEIQQGEGYTPAPADGFPIVAWTGIEAENAFNKFVLMKDAGINTYLGWYDDVETVLRVLDAAEQAGVKVIASSPELSTDTEETVKAWMGHPALYGYHLDDEPEVSELEGLGQWVRQIQAVDSYHPCYINLYPNWAWGKEQYANHVNLFLQQAPVPFLSFDNYPVVSIDGNPNILRPDWYRNLEEVASAAKKKGIPFWAFALALSHRLDATHFYRVPTLPELRLQVFSNLAYGAQAIQYFTFHGIYIDSKTAVYDLVKTVNQEVQQFADVFLGASVLGVWHTGAELPEGTQPLGALPDEIRSLTTSEGGAVVSLLENKGNQYFMVVNKDFRNAMDLTMEVNGGGVSNLSKEGQQVSVTNATWSVDAGDWMIFTWKKK